MVFARNAAGSTPNGKATTIHIAVDLAAHQIDRVVLSRKAIINQQEQKQLPQYNLCTCKHSVSATIKGLSLNSYRILNR